MKLLKTFSASLLLTACSGINAPDARWGMVNPAGREVVSYNLKTDYIYDKDGMKLKPKAKPVYLPAASLWDLEGWVCMSPKDFAKARSAVEQMISRQERGCN